MTVLPLDIARDHPAFEGHFPSRPIVPGVVLLDHGLRAIESHRGQSLSFGLGAVKFLSFVLPGEPVRLEYETATGDSLRLRIYAGAGEHERLALNGTITAAGRP